jgi:hypothetical protein
MGGRCWSILTRCINVLESQESEIELANTYLQSPNKSHTHWLLHPDFYALTRLSCNGHQGPVTLRTPHVSTVWMLPLVPSQMNSASSHMTRLIRPERSITNRELPEHQNADRTRSITTDRTFLQWSDTSDHQGLVTLQPMTACQPMNSASGVSGRCPVPVSGRSHLSMCA